MENITSILRESWNNIKFYETGSLQIGIKHPLEWYVAYETPTNKALVILSNQAIDSLESSKSISTVCRKREDGMFYISFLLTENSQEDVFISMCSNLIDFSADALSEKDALKKVAFRYKQWRRLMEYRNIAILSDEKRRGLIGELLYLKKIIENQKPIIDALNGWVGPDGADQDFVYDGLWREIKTTGLSSDQISIHSVEQLGSYSDHGELYIYRVDSCAPEVEGAFTLRNLVDELTTMFDGDLSIVDLFTEKLNEVGYIDMSVYDTFYYKYYRNDKYDVDETFPRITRNDLRSEIIKCDYVLSVSSIEDWKRS